MCIIFGIKINGNAGIFLIYSVRADSKLWLKYQEYYILHLMRQIVKMYVLWQGLSSDI